jgi:hypothetical protein
MKRNRIKLLMLETLQLNMTQKISVINDLHLKEFRLQIQKLFIKYRIAILPKHFR